MEEMKLTFEDAPHGYALCFNHNCKLHEVCMHYYMGTMAPADKTSGAAIYPMAWKDGTCRHFAKTEKVDFAWGFNGLYKHLSGQAQTQARMALRARMGHGASAYYRVHNGEKLLSPARQQEIIELVSEYGQVDERPFDHYVTQYNFT